MVQGLAFTPAVADLEVDLKGPVGSGRGLHRTALGPGRCSPDGTGSSLPAFTPAVIDLTPGSACLLQVVEGFVEPAQAAVSLTEVVGNPGLTLFVLQVVSRGEANLVDSNPVSPVSTQVEEISQDTREFPGDDMLAALCGVASDGHQIGAFGLTPFQRLTVAGEDQR